MKAFSFGLEQALAWREAQVSAQKLRAAAAAAHASGIRTAVDSRKAEAASSAADLLREPTGVALALYAAFIDKSRARIRDLDAKLVIAQRTLAGEMDRLIDANRKLRLLENLKRAEQGRWRQEFDRELAAFADEAFLCRIPLKTRSKLQLKNGRARSSGG